MTHIAIAGAGIGGLSAALALGRAGHRVTLFERRDGFTEVGAGLQLSPNATRRLRAWGVLDEVAAIGTEPEAIRIRRARDGSDLTNVPTGDAVARFGAPFVLLHRADLQRVLVAAVRRLPSVDLRLATPVDSVLTEQNGALVQIATAGGSAAEKADGFVDAGGFRTALAGASDSRTRPVRSPFAAWRALVPALRVSRDMTQPRSNLWLGPEAHLVHYPLRGGTLVNVVAIVERSRGARAESGDVWSSAGDRSDLLPAFSGWHPDALDLLRAAPAWNVWPLYESRNDAAWSSGLQTRLGDAAHAMLPFLAQGASQSIEDAAALELAVTRSPTDVGAAFRAFEAERRKRATRTLQASRRQGTVYHLGGGAALARDAVMRLLGPRGMMNRMAWLYAH